MKKFFSGIAIGLMLLAGVAFAGTITATGMNQGDLFKFLTGAKDRINGLLYVQKNRNGTVSDANFGVSASNTKNVNATSAIEYFLPEGANTNSTAFYTRATGADFALNAGCNCTTGKYGGWYFTINSAGTITSRCVNGTNPQSYDSSALVLADMPTAVTQSGETLVGYMWATNSTGGEFNATSSDISSSNYQIYDYFLFNGNSTLSNL